MMMDWSVIFDDELEQDAKNPNPSNLAARNRKRRIYTKRSEIETI